MILGKLFRSRLVYRYIISYIFVFLIPFICLSLFIYYQSASSLQKEIEQSNVNKLEQVETITNERINELEKMASSIAYTPGLSPYMVKHGYYGGEATKELRTFKENSSIIGEVFVYYYDQDPFLYSSNGPYTFQSLLQHSYQFETLTAEMLKKSLHEKIPNVLLPDKVTFRNGTQEQVMAFIYPIAPGNPNPYGAVMFFVQESLLTNLIENILNDFQGSTYILDENQQPIVSAVNGDGLAWEHLAQDVLQQKGVHTLQLDNKEYSISSVTSEVSGWTFVTIMDTDQFTDRVIQQETLWGVLCMILLIIGVTVAVLMAQNQYRPIERLAKLTKNNQPAANWSDRNEIETIHQTIADMMEDRQQLSETIDLQEPYAKGQLLHNMLKGNFSNEDTIDELLAALHMSMHQGPHFVMIIEWMSDVPDRDPWMSSLLDSLLPM
ncbi:cache domain-containing protein [Gracilibacillus alcaliphilus]|uniref:cache domain-containing protein n=1 Tax=Gracilibacillus alcaliphilus TaxID=1401441 RepID=UPI00195E9C35|nr:cache domain-containing protein [Gracilibacillus alcaliphilus]MBM7677264.1 hypothetical protein [Gracilibacillus alcaliphilus]